MLVVLGVVVFFTMMGFMGLQMATKDAQVSGSLLDIKSKESAAWGGLNYALGAMQADPANIATQLQKFIADSSVAVASKRKWFSFANGSFSLVATDPGFTSIGGSGDRSAVKVRLISMDINGATGSIDGSGVSITLESTGQGRSGQQLRVIATYRMLGIDVPQSSVGATAAGGPSFAFYLNGAIATGNMGNDVNGSVFINGTSSFNTAAPITNHIQRIRGRLIVNGGLSINDSLIVDSNAVIHGTLAMQSYGARFKQNLILDDLSVNSGHWVDVDSSMVFRGTGYSTSYYFNNLVAGLRVGKDFVALQADAFTIGGGSPLTIGRNAWMLGFLQQNQAKFSVGGNLEVVGNPANGFSIPDKATGNVITGHVAARNLVGQNLKFGHNNAASHLVGGAIYSSTGIDVNTTNFSSKDILTGSAGLVNSAGTSFNVAGNMWVRNQGAVSLKPTIAGNLCINGTTSNPFSGWTLSGASRIFRYNNAGAPTVSILGAGATTYPRGSDTTFPTPESVVGTYPAPPHPVADMRFSASDTAATYAANPPDTMYVDATHSPTVNSKVIVLNNALCAAATAAGYPVATNNWTGTDFNNLHSYLSSLGKLINGYMVIDVTAASTLSSINNRAPAFTGKALWIIEKAVTVGGNWPSSASSAATQVFYVKAGGSLANFGFGGNLYGYIHFETAMTGNGSFIVPGTVLYGAIGVRGAGSSWTPNSGNLTIQGTPSVFTDITTNLPGVFHPATSSGMGSGLGTAQTSTKTLTVRTSATGIQFVRVGEFR